MFAFILEAMTYGYFGGVVDDQWFKLAESAQEGPTTTRMIARSKRTGSTYRILIL